jgi:hypothetical protein
MPSPTPTLELPTPSYTPSPRTDPDLQALIGRKKAEHYRRTRQAPGSDKARWGCYNGAGDDWNHVMMMAVAARARGRRNCKRQGGLGPHGAARDGGGAGGRERGASRRGGRSTARMLCPH